MKIKNGVWLIEDQSDVVDTFRAATRQLNLKLFVTGDWTDFYHTDMHDYPYKSDMVFIDRTIRGSHVGVSDGEVMSKLLMQTFGNDLLRISSTFDTKPVAECDFAYAKNTFHTNVDLTAFFIENMYKHLRARNT